MKRTRGSRFQKFGFFWDVGGGRRIPGLMVSFGRKKKEAFKKAFYDFFDVSSVSKKKTGKKKKKSMKL